MNQEFETKKTLKTFSPLFLVPKTTFSSNFFQTIKLTLQLAISKRRLR